MATFRLYDAVYQYSSYDINYNSAKITKATSSVITVTDNARGVMNLFGSFVYSGSSLSGGTITGVNILKGGSKLFEIKNASFNILDMVNEVDSGGINAGIEYLMSGDDKVFGANQADKLLSYEGNDKLNGRGGADIMKGGQGDDTYIVDHKNDVASEKFGEGIDTVKAKVHYALKNNLENLILKGKDNLKATGNDSDNEIIGNKGNNVLKGLDGNDNLNGKAGNDKILGGLGDDIIIGGEGDDILSGGLDADTFLWSKNDLPSDGFSLDIVNDFNSVEGDILDLSDLLSDSSHSLEAVSENDYLQLILKDTSNDIVQVVDLTNVSVFSDMDATNLMNAMLTSGAIDDGV
jgi:Ca2+-binding RTX toxin-like protein